MSFPWKLCVLCNSAHALQSAPSNSAFSRIFVLGFTIQIMKISNLSGSLTFKFELWIAFGLVLCLCVIQNRFFNEQNRFLDSRIFPKGMLRDARKREIVLSLTIAPGIFTFFSCIWFLVKVSCFLGNQYFGMGENESFGDLVSFLSVSRYFL